MNVFFIKLRIFARKRYRILLRLLLITQRLKAMIRGKSAIQLEPIEKIKGTKIERLLASRPNGWDVYRIMQGHAFGAYGGGVMIENQVVSEFLKYPWGAKYHPIFISHSSFHIKRKIPSAYLITTPESKSNYYHFLLDEIPRLLNSIEATPSVERQAIHIIDSGNSKFKAQWFDLLKIDQNKILYIKEKELIAVEQLIVSRFRPESKRGLQDAITLLRKEVKPFIKAANWDSPKKIYISRNQSATRRLINEEILLNNLTRQGFVRVCLEELNVRKQIELFSRAEIVVSPHGAGLANMVFLPPSARVIEIISAHCDKVFYSNIASCLGTTHFKVHASPDSAIKNDGVYANQANLFLPETGITEILDLVQ